MNTIQFPAILARVANLPEGRLEADGKTLRELIEHLCERHAGLRGHLFYDNSRLKDHFLFTSAGELVEPDLALPAGSSIEVMLAASGGIDTATLSNEEVQRYVRHITLPGVGRQGQQKLKDAKVLVIGTGGLGSPVSLYLAAAGVGRLGLIDFDVVESSNLQRQVVHGNSTLGMPKVESAKRRLQDLNSCIEICTRTTLLSTPTTLFGSSSSTTLSWTEPTISRRATWSTTLVPNFVSRWSMAPSTASKVRSACSITTTAPAIAVCTPVARQRSCHQVAVPVVSSESCPGWWGSSKPPRPSN